VQCFLDERALLPDVLQLSELWFTSASITSKSTIATKSTRANLSGCCAKR